MNVKVGVSSYKIKQNVSEGKLVLELYFDNPDGDCKAYAQFMDDFKSFLKERGYAPPSIEPQCFPD